jgi:hypothetical protein
MHRALPCLLAALVLADAPQVRAVVVEPEVRAAELLRSEIAPRLAALERAPTYRGTLAANGERVGVVAAVLELAPTYRALVLVEPRTRRAAVVWAYTSGPGALLHASFGPMTPRIEERGGYCGECTMPLDGAAVAVSLGFDREHPLVLDLAPAPALRDGERRALIAAALYEPELGLFPGASRRDALSLRARVTAASPGPGPDAAHPICSILHDVHLDIRIGLPARPSIFSMVDLVLDASTRRCCTPPYRGCCSAPPEHCIELPAPT